MPIDCGLAVEPIDGHVRVGWRFISSRAEARVASMCLYGWPPEAGIWSGRGQSARVWSGETRPAPSP